MKNFFKMMLASTLGVIIASFILGFLFFSMIVAIAVSSVGTPAYELKANTILKIDLKGSISDRVTPNPFTLIMGKSSSIGLDDILSSIKKAKDNDKIKGIYLRCANLSTGISNSDCIRRALVDFKESGKFIVAYADSYAQDTYFISSVADKVILNPQGSLSFMGMSAGPMFMKGLYKKIGIEHQVFKVGTFKSAVEPLIEDKMSDANREQMSSFINDIWGTVLKGISEGRNISVEKLNSYADECLLFAAPKTLIEYNMIDTLMYATEAEDYLKTLANIDEEKKIIFASVKNMTSVEQKVDKKDRTKNRIAVLYAEGAIVDDGDKGSPFNNETVITAKQYVAELKKLEKNDDVKAVVFRVNSGGGSAYASEQIWKAVMDLKKKKPVVVSMGSYAASGGYYISAPADVIVAEPTTLTGSIGIFGVIPNGEELYKKIGVSFDEVKTNEHAGFGGQFLPIPLLGGASSRAMTDSEKKMLQKHIEKGYDLFLSRCAEGRSKTNEEIDAIGQGRVWTGAQALELGLVDALGGLDEAVKIAAEKAEIEKYRISSYPGKKDAFEDIFSELIGDMKVSITKMIMGEEAFKQKQLIQYYQSSDVRMAIMLEDIRF